MGIKHQNQDIKMGQICQIQFCSFQLMEGDGGEGVPIYLLVKQGTRFFSNTIVFRLNFVN